MNYIGFQSNFAPHTPYARVFQGAASMGTGVGRCVREPTSIPARLNTTPTSCGGQKPSGAKISSKIQEDSPSTIDAMAPLLVARFQYMPKVSGMKAATSVTL